MKFIYFNISLFNMQLFPTPESPIIIILKLMKSPSFETSSFGIYIIFLLSINLLRYNVSIIPISIIPATINNE